MPIGDLRLDQPFVEGVVQRGEHVRLAGLLLQRLPIRVRAQVRVQVRVRVGCLRRLVGGPLELPELLDQLLARALEQLLARKAALESVVGLGSGLVLGLGLGLGLVLWDTRVPIPEIDEIEEIVDTQPCLLQQTSLLLSLLPLHVPISTSINGTGFITVRIVAIPCQETMMPHESPKKNILKSIPQVMKYPAVSILSPSYRNVNQKASSLNLVG